MQATIGETAGRIWSQLSQKGPQPTKKLVRDLGMPRDQIERAIGWLARENKVSMESVKGAETLRLK